jgi:hypothetical protein
LLAGLVSLAVSLAAWFGLGIAVKAQGFDREHLQEREMTDPHGKIDQMLTEARVILPGVQAMLGFQLIVVMTAAAVHRLAFCGNNDTRLHRSGTVLVTAALVPLAFAIPFSSGGARLI